MSIGWMIVILIGLFGVLGFGADLLVGNIKRLADHWRINIFFLGLMLGLLTSVPEIILGVNSIHRGISSLSMGNLLGGIIILLGLVLGVAIVANREIKTDGLVWKVLPSLLLFALPLILGLKGWLNRWDGLLMILAYVVMIIYDYWHTRRTSLLKVRTLPELIEETSAEEHDFLDWCRRQYRIWRPIRFINWLTNRYLWLAVVGFLLVIIAADQITNIAQKLLLEFNLTPLFMGSAIFAIGTNLPEIVVTIKSCLRNVGELSISHIMGSAVSNILIIGVILQFTKLKTGPSVSFYLTSVATVLLASLFLLFYKTDRRFNRWEGWVLISVYIIFIASQWIWALS